jgi:hypothetical protein
MSLEPWEVVDSTWLLRSSFMRVQARSARRDPHSARRLHRARRDARDGPRGGRLPVRDVSPRADEDEEIEVETVPLERAAGYLEDAASTRRVFLGALTGGVESLGRTFPLLARADEMIR